MHLTPAILEAAYTYLRATPPFNKWKLPESDAVEFHVHNIKKEMGSFGGFGTPQPRIRISQHHCSKSLMLLETMAHEMVHMHQFDGRSCKGYTSVDHGPKFNRLAAQVCRQHGFDLKTF